VRCWYLICKFHYECLIVYWAQSICSMIDKHQYFNNEFIKNRIFVKSIISGSIKINAEPLLVIVFDLHETISSTKKCAPDFLWTVMQY